MEPHFEELEQRNAAGVLAIPPVSDAPATDALPVTAAEVRYLLADGTLEEAQSGARGAEISSHESEERGKRVEKKTRTENDPELDHTAKEASIGEMRLDFEDEIWEKDGLNLWVPLNKQVMIDLGFDVSKGNGWTDTEMDEHTKEIFEEEDGGNSRQRRLYSEDSQTSDEAEDERSWDRNSFIRGSVVPTSNFTPLKRSEFPIFFVPHSCNPTDTSALQRALSAQEGTIDNANAAIVDFNDRFETAVQGFYELQAHVNVNEPANSPLTLQVAGYGATLSALNFQASSAQETFQASAAELSASAYALQQAITNDHCGDYSAQVTVLAGQINALGQQVNQTVTAVQSQLGAVEGDIAQLKVDLGL